MSGPEPAPCAIVSTPNPQRLPDWVDAIRDALPGWDIRPAGQPGETEAADYLVVWKPPPGWIAGFRKLKAVASIGAGADHILSDPTFPAALPILKTVGADLTQRMREYVALHVLRLHREMPLLEQYARRAEWHPVIAPPATRRRVGVMGLGPLGRAAAATLMDLGFQVSGWSRRGAGIAGMQSFRGADGLGRFLAQCDILVCLLPLTPETEGILDGALFAALPRGASVINAARGGHLAEADLLAALASGQVAAATLDVFRTEPLPRDHPFWTHPRILVTPHVASLIDPETGAAIIAENLRAYERSGRAPYMADAARGY